MLEGTKNGVGGDSMKGWGDKNLHITVNPMVATVLGSIPASSDTVESEERRMKQC